MTDKIKPEWGAGLCLRVLNMYDVLCPAHLYLLLLNLHSSCENDSVWIFFFLERFMPGRGSEHHKEAVSLILNGRQPLDS